MPCPECRDPVAVMQADTGTLSYKCQHADCESSGFAAAHTGAARRWIAALPKPASGPAVVPEGVPTPAALPKPKAKPTAFGLGDL